MKTSQLLLSTLREAPAETEIISHQLIVRAGMVRKTAAGIYTWLPLGLRVLRKVENIVREEMNRSGAQEVAMSFVQPAELWQESGRWNEYGPELLRIQDRHKREFCLGPTHEEMITDLVRHEIHSYKQLPINLYQIQTKFRDEIRPRFGIMRAREFLMKDAYSFHLSEESLKEHYQLMYDTYAQIFSRIGLSYRAVLADSGNIGGATSHEFHVLADSGEDQIVFNRSGDYAINLELAQSVPPAKPRSDPNMKMEQVATPTQKTIQEVSVFLKTPEANCLKTLIVDGENQQPIALVLRGSDTLNIRKAEKLPQIASPLKMTDPDTIKQTIGCDIGSIGPVGLPIPVIADCYALHTADFVCGANKDGFHLVGCNWLRDLPEPESADLRNVQSGDQTMGSTEPVDIACGIEVGHIFQLGKKYSAAMGLNCLDQTGRSQVLTMGCYGIGISRIVAAAIEQHHDEKGIIWPQNIAPFQVLLIGVNTHKSKRLSATIEDLYTQLKKEHIDVLLDNRKERLGVMLNDSELIGIPHRLVLSDKGLDENRIEYTARNILNKEFIPLDETMQFIQARLLQNPT